MSSRYMYIFLFSVRALKKRDLSQSFGPWVCFCVPCIKFKGKIHFWNLKIPFPDFTTQKKWSSISVPASDFFSVFVTLNTCMYRVVISLCEFGIQERIRSEGKQRRVE